MDGKTFVRVFLFASSYGHGWASTLYSPSSVPEPKPEFDPELDPRVLAFNDAVEKVIPFDRAVDAWHHAMDDEERGDVEAVMVSLVDTEEKQRTLLGHSYTIQTIFEEDSDCEFGILAREVFSEKKAGPLEYRHSTGSGRLTVYVHDGVADFSISRPGEPDLFCLRVDGGTCSICSGEPDSPLDEEACWCRWERHLRLRHVLALRDALGAFFALKEDRDLLQRLLAAVDKTAISVFRAQEESIELYCSLGSARYTPKVFLSEMELSDETRSALRDALVHPSDEGVPALIPFDCTPSAPGADSWRETFELPLDAKSPRSQRGTLVVPASAQEWYSGWSYTNFFFVCGVEPCEIRHFAELHKRENPSAGARDLYDRGVADAIKAKRKEGAEKFLRCVYYNVDSPERSVAELGADPEEVEIQRGIE